MFKKKPPSHLEENPSSPSAAPDKNPMDAIESAPAQNVEEKGFTEKAENAQKSSKEEEGPSLAETKAHEHPHKKEGACCCSGHHDHHQHHHKPLSIELIECQEKNLRLLAEMENARKRMQKEKSETLQFAIENTILEFLPILDNFENALKFSKQASEEVQKWAQGFEMILAQLKNILLDHGIFPFDSKGSHFDSHQHEALHIEETDEVPDGTILEEYARGYKTKTRTLRPANVKVAKTPKKQEMGTSEEPKAEEEVLKTLIDEEKQKKEE